MPKINVQEVSLLKVDHNVVGVTVPETEDVACHAIASCRPDEGVSCLLQLLFPLVRIVFLEVPSHEGLHGVIAERVENRVFELNGCQSL